MYYEPLCQHISILFLGNVPIFDHFLSDDFNDLYHVQDKNLQQMGATVYSAGNVFIVSINYIHLMCIYIGLCTNVGIHSFR